jgi:hypothetical protein
MFHHDIIFQLCGGFWYLEVDNLQVQRVSLLPISGCFAGIYTFKKKFVGRSVPSQGFTQVLLAFKIT